VYVFVERSVPPTQHGYDLTGHPGLRRRGHRASLHGRMSVPDLQEQRVELMNDAVNVFKHIKCRPECCVEITGSLSSFSRRRERLTIK
jgi:hypothetical protein